ncbi:hypothetical protein N7495_009792, partial [Penicillium taxi]|uniref:uncharacterized protein n=1 Tax=Penicillium taxi TaxID=168475 RepID=UPI00254576F2
IVMPARHQIGASRRQRKDDDGEDEDSLVGDLEDESMSEQGSLDSEDADAEGSDSSSSTSPTKHEPNSTVLETEAMLNELNISDPEEIHRFSQTEEDRMTIRTGRAPSAPSTGPNRDTFAARKRREHEKYMTERDQNPAFVPTRGSFFLHDKRTAESNKGKSRPYGLIVDGNTRRNLSKPDASAGQWTHDLHETVAGANPPASKASIFPPSATIPSAPQSVPPNRSFSSTTLIGNVPVVVSLPGMTKPVTFPAVPKKQHTRLPQHRPPLRRDKPVRISLPNSPPRYHYPSPDRSFIFIPRALRPNQYRGRGRGGSYYPPRRPSSFGGSFGGGSTYAPSVVSPRSSLGMPPSQDGYPSPAGSRIEPYLINPVARLPYPPFLPGGSYLQGPPQGPPMMPLPMNMPPVPYRESRPAHIPMQHPRPQKAVPLENIENPATFPLNPPQPQQEQPFHQQVPSANDIGSGGTTLHGPPSHASGTPLSQIPERAVHAPPFMPWNNNPGIYGYPPGYSTGYPPGYPIYYPVPGPEYGYHGPMSGMSIPNFSPQQPYFPNSGDQSHPGIVYHESGGTHFYDVSHMHTNSDNGSGPGGVVGMGGMMTPPGMTYSGYRGHSSGRQ